MIDFISSNIEVLFVIFGMGVFALIFFFIISVSFKVLGRINDLTFWYNYLPIFLISLGFFYILAPILIIYLVLFILFLFGFLTYFLLNFFSISEEVIYGCMTLSAFFGIWVIWKVLSFLYYLRMDLIAKNSK